MAAKDLFDRISDRLRTEIGDLDQVHTRRSAINLAVRDASAAIKHHLKAALSEQEKAEAGLYHDSELELVQYDAIQQLANTATVASNLNVFVQSDPKTFIAYLRKIDEPVLVDALKQMDAETSAKLFRAIEVFRK